MDAPASLSLIDRLLLVAALWADAQGCKTSRLGRLVVGDGDFFESVRSRPMGPTTVTLEKFARFLADPGNWPDGVVPEQARAFAHVTGVSSPERDAA